jgi:hypothetical protein
LSELREYIPSDEVHPDAETVESESCPVDAASLAPEPGSPFGVAEPGSPFGEPASVADIFSGIGISTEVETSERFALD